MTFNKLKDIKIISDINIILKSKILNKKNKTANLRNIEAFVHFKQINSFLKYINITNPEIIKDTIINSKNNCNNLTYNDIFNILNTYQLSHLLNDQTAKVKLLTYMFFTKIKTIYYFTRVYLKEVILATLLIGVFMFSFTSNRQAIVYQTNTNFILTNKLVNESRLEYFGNPFNEVTLIEIHSPFPKSFEYTSINKESIKEYLIARGSILQKDEYLDVLIDEAKINNVNPLLLLAIIGQEQGFVPLNHQYSKKIINNPYNVHESWLHYNTNLRDSTNIACHTIYNILESRPRNFSPFEWLNKKYATDKNWKFGVEYIYNELTQLNQ